MTYRLRAVFRVFVAAIGLWFLIVLSGAHAQTAPSGWSTKPTATQWSAQSADTGSGPVKLVYYPVQSTSENFERWFVAASEQRARAMGTITQTHGQASQSYTSPYAPLIALMRTVKASDRKEYYVESYAYDTMEGLQLVQIISPISVPESNDAYRAALASVASGWQSSVFYKPAAPPTEAIPPPPAGKKNCKREPVWGWAVRYGCSPSAVCNERVIKRYEWVCDP